MPTLARECNADPKGGTERRRPVRCASLWQWAHGAKKRPRQPYCREKARYWLYPDYVGRLLAPHGILGPDHSDVGMALHNLGNLYRGQRRDECALPLCERSLNLVEQSLGAGPKVGSLSF